MIDKQRLLILAALGIVVWLLIINWQKDYGDKPAETIAEVETSNQFVLVENNQIIAKIDKKGGDLVYLSLKDYPESVKRKDTPFVVLNNGNLINVARSALMGQNGLDAKGRPMYLSEKDSYQSENGNIEVVLTTEQEGVAYKKIYTFKPDSYLIDIRYEIDNKSANALLIQLSGDLKRNGADDPSAANASFIPLPTYLGGAYGTPEEQFNKIDFDDFNEDNPKLMTENGWVGMVQHYFLTAWIPNEGEQVQLSTKQKTNETGEMNYIGFKGQQVLVNPNTQETLSAQLFVGPKIQEQMAAIRPGLEQTVDYGFLWFIAKYIFVGLQYIYGLVGNWGVAIILLTFVIKVILFPLSYSSYKSMARMRKFAPKMKTLREKYKDDRQKLSQEMMALYKKEKINPAGGCLPMLLQMPVFLSLYWVLLESVELRQSPFLWIEDLSLLDPLFILPLLMGASMFFQMRLNPAPQEPMQQAVMKYMPIMFTVMFLFFPAGLVLYWLTNNILTIAQQWWINRSQDA